MNIHSLKKCLWLSLALTIVIAGGLAMRSYEAERHERNARYYKYLSILDPKQRVELGEELATALCGELPSSYNMAVLERKALLYKQSIERNANWDRQPVPANLVERTGKLRSPEAIQDGLEQIKRQLIQLGRLNWGYLEAQREFAMYGPFDQRSYSMANLLAGEIDYKQIWMWAIYFCLVASLLSALVNCCRASELRITPLLLFFLPEFFLINAGGIGFVPGFMNKYKPEEVKRRAWRNAMGFFSGLFSFLGVGGKAFAQSEQKRDEAATNPAGLVANGPSRPTLEVSCTVSAASQFHAGLDAAIFFPGPVTSLSCTAKRARLFMGAWMQAPSLSAVPGSTAQEIDVFAGFSSHTGPVKTTLALNYANPSPILKIGRGDALLVTLQANVDEQKVGKVKLAHFGNVVYATPIKGSKPGRGWIASTGSGYNIALTDSWSLGGQVKVIRDFGAFGFPKAYLGYASTGLIRDLGSGVTLTLPSVVASTPFTAGSNRSTYVTVGASISKSWK